VDPNKTTAKMRGTLSVYSLYTLIQWQQYGLLSLRGRGVDPNKTTAKKAWASVNLFPLHINTMAALCVAELRRGRGGSK
jgi:hypothetical protein